MLQALVAVDLPLVLVVAAVKNVISRTISSGLAFTARSEEFSPIN